MTQAPVVEHNSTLYSPCSRTEAQRVCQGRTICMSTLSQLCPAWTSGHPENETASGRVQPSDLQLKFLQFSYIVGHNNYHNVIINSFMRMRRVWLEAAYANCFVNLDQSDGRDFKTFRAEVFKNKVGVMSRSIEDASQVEAQHAPFRATQLVSPVALKWTRSS